MQRTVQSRSSPRPNAPVYVISKGRPGVNALTARCLVKDGVDFKLVVEPQERAAYAEDFEQHLLVTPFSNLGLGSIPVRNFIWEHAKSNGHQWHWCVDDNIRYFRHRFKGRRWLCNANVAFAGVEEFVNRYENIAIGGMNYASLCPDKQKVPPFYLNCHVYSCLLIRTDLSFKWRGRYNEDTDLCLQALTRGLCTVNCNVFLAEKAATLTMKGGNSDDLYQGDGRVRMSRALQRMWPGLVETRRRFGRAQHYVVKNWAMFNTPLKRKPGVKVFNAPRPEFAMKIVQKREQGLQSPTLRALLGDKLGEEK